MEDFGTGKRMRDMIATSSALVLVFGKRCISVRGIFIELVALVAYV